MEHPLRKIPRKQWPEPVESIAQVIGAEAAMNLFIRFNGRYLHVPLDCPAGHPIEQTIGSEKAALLCKKFGAERLVFPKGVCLLRKIRNAAILADWRAGMTQADIATRYGLTCRHINTIINHTPLETPHV